MFGWEGSNRRKFPRANYPCLVEICDREGEVQDTILTHTENIGVGGICVILKKSLKLFTPVEVELDLLDLGNHIKCKGKVVWNVKRKTTENKKPLFYDIGIEFEKLDDAENKRVQQIIDKLHNRKKH